MNERLVTDEDGFPVGATQFFWADPLGTDPITSGEARRAVRQGWGFTVDPAGAVIVDDMKGGPGIAPVGPTAAELADDPEGWTINDRGDYVRTEH